MTRKKTGNDILDKLYEEHDKLEEEIIKLSQKLGWCDEDGSFEPLERNVMEISTELENKRIKSRSDKQKEALVTKMSVRLNRLTRKIKEIEKNTQSARD